MDTFVLKPKRRKWPLKSLNRGTLMVDFGLPIPNSRYYRCHCFGCGEPMRTTRGGCEAIRAGTKEIWCQECSPCHQGCGHDFAQKHGLDNDTDAWKLSWKTP